MASSALLPPPPPLNTVVVLILLLSCFISTSFSLRVISDHKPNTKPLGFSTRLIHRDSPESPFYDPRLTDADRWRNALQRSFGRYEHYTRNIMVQPKDMRAPIRHHDFEYVISFRMGTPPVQTYSTIDTGSGLTWFQCRPCDKCYDQYIPIFDPRKSTSYAKVGCEDAHCKLEYRSKCDKDGISCIYKIEYGDTGQSQGTLSTETFIFQHDNSTGSITRIPSFPFGCGHNNSFPYYNGSDLGRPGVFGLNKGPLSWIYQLSFDSFSHCFVPRDWVNKTSLLRFGTDAIITAKSSTPMVEFGNYTARNYYVGMEGISVGSTRLDIPEEAFEISEDGEGGVIVDSGTATTRLTINAFEPLITELEKQIKLEKVPPPPGSNIALCYKGNAVAYILLLSMPDITFHLSGLNFVLQKWNVWIDVGDDKICLTIVQATDNYVTLIGAQHLQNVNVGYDLKNKLISFFDRDCTRT